MGFEFSGYYHHEPEDGVSEEAAEEIHETQVRDSIKEGLSRRAQIELVTVTGVQLRPQVFRKLIPAVLPLRTVDVAGPYYAGLAKMCESYASYVVRQAAMKAGAGGGGGGVGGGAGWRGRS